MKRKKIIPYFFVLTFLSALFITFSSYQVKAETLSDYVPYTPGASESGMITENGPERQYYRFTLQESGQIQITGNAHIESMYLYLYDENASELWNSSLYWNSTSEVISLNESLYLTSGSYYLCIRRNYSHVGSFNFKIDFTSSNETFNEKNGGSNNTITEADDIKVDGTNYNGQIAKNDDKDFYRFTLQESGNASFNATFFGMSWVYWKLYDESGQELLSKNPFWNNTTENIVVSEDLHLTSGIYYIAVSKESNYCGKYTFSIAFTSSKESYPEVNGGSNNAAASASPMTLGISYSGQIAINDEKDFYKFSLSSSQSVSIHVEAEMEYIYIKLYDADGNELWSKNPYWNPVTKKVNYTETSVLEKGTYCIAVVQYSSRYGNYELTVAELTQENCPHEYDSEWHDATYFSKGYRQYRCKLCGHTYKDDYTAVRKLSQGYLSSSCSTGKGSLILTWSYVSEASGYNIRYSTDKSLKSGVVLKKVTNPGTTQKTIKGLARRKTYYVQVRPYKTKGSKTVYGKWSVKRKLKTQ